MNKLHKQRFLRWGLIPFIATLVTVIAYLPFKIEQVKKTSTNITKILKRDLIIGDFNEVRVKVENVSDEFNSINFKQDNKLINLTPVIQSLIPIKFNFPLAAPGTNYRFGTIIYEFDLIQMLLKDKITIFISMLFVILFLTILMLFVKRIESLNNTLIQQKNMNKLIRQVAHDLKSPIELMQRVFETLDKGELSLQEKLNLRKALTRVMDVSDNLLIKNKQDNFLLIDLTPIIQDIIFEKETIWKTKKHFVFKKKLSQKNFFIWANPSDIKRALSNIIENAIEAIQENGIVGIDVKLLNEFVVVEISDDGIGMEEKMIQRVLCNENFSTKENGNGIGLSGAKNLVEKNKGHLYLSSNIGLKVILTFQEAETENIVAQNFNSNIQSIALIDDEIHFQNIFKDKFNNFVVQTYSHPGQIKHNVFDAIFCDFEFRGEKNGINSLKSLDCKEKILITNHYLNEDEITQIRLSNIKFLPKHMINEFVDFKENTIIDLVLVDDDKYVRLDWEKESKLAKKNLVCFEDSLGLLQNIEKISKQTPIYLDHYLKNELGSELAKKLRKLGYSNLHLISLDEEAIYDFPYYITRQSKCFLHTSGGKNEEINGSTGHNSFTFRSS